MAAPDCLMSSPPRSRAFAATNLSSSSPCLPSLEEIFMRKSPRKPPLRTGNPAAPTSNDCTTFTNAADVLREAPEIDIDTEKVTDSPPRGTRQINVRKCGASTPDNLRNHQVSKQRAVLIESSSPTDKPWQKFKKQASPQHDEHSLSPTKPKNAIPMKRPERTSDTVSRHFAKINGDSLPKIDTQTKGAEVIKKDSVDGALAAAESELAIPRRGDWTPPTAKQLIVLDSDSDARELFSSVDRPSVSKDVFQTLYEEYGRQGTDAAPGLPPQNGTEILGKRKLIEFISTGQKQEKEKFREAMSLEDMQQPFQPQKRVEAKEPAPRKKTRTITELATAPFVAPIAAEPDLAGPNTRESMLEYFDSDGAVKALVEHQTIVMTQRKSKGKETKQPPKARRRKKAGTQADPILLSPGSALKQSSNQDFVFGTSSQLVDEESPTALRDIQAAIRASNNLNSNPSGARDEQGELVGFEFVDLQHDLKPTEPSMTTTPNAESFVDINDLLDSPVPASLAPSAPGESLRTEPHLLQSCHSEQSSSSASLEVEGSVGATSAESRPKYELFTDAQLCKQITSYGFKPVKKRTAMIALLDQCWKSKHQVPPARPIQSLSISTHSPTQARQGSTTNITNQTAAKPNARGRSKKTEDEKTLATRPTSLDNASPKRSRGSSVASPPKSRGRSKKNETAPVLIKESVISASSPKKSRGRAKKSSSASIEIPDSANNTPSPVSSPDPVFTSPPPLDLTMLEEGNVSLLLSPTDQQSELFKYITMAVTSTPRSQDPSKPSWYEKMLLYDPIILEELTRWLNGGELTRAGYDGEVSPLDVKAWCESKSVVCLWQQNSRGRERKRY
ncbi:hypothetical protein F4861DRAFT_529440 [Xylaria intraflava]|nr:hypothetical protein F4861DRAFT_529440 [Xylaria intraflava]